MKYSAEYYAETAFGRSLIKKDLLWTKTLSLEPIVNVNGVNVTDVDCIILSTYTSFFVLVKKLYKIKFL